MSDLIDISGATEAEVKQWRHWYTLASRGQAMLSAPPPVANEIPVLNPEVRRLMTMVDSMPRGMEFRLGPKGKSWPLLFSLAKAATTDLRVVRCHEG